MAKIYVASSWRNKYQPKWNLAHPVAEKGFKADMDAML